MVDTWACCVCGEEKLRNEFRVRGSVGVRGECRACRKKMQDRQRSKDQSYTQALKKKLVARSTSLTKQWGQLVMKEKLALVKSNFLKASAVTRTRIRIMENLKNGNERTQKAIARRKLLLEKMETQYAENLMAVREGREIVRM